MATPDDPAGGTRDDLLADGSFLFDASPCGYVCAAPDGRIVKVNRTFLDLTGRAREELTGRRFVDLLTGGGRIYYETHLVPMLRMQGEVHALALDLVRADGSRLPVLVNAVLDTDTDGRALLLRFVTFDATERRTYERELLHAKQRAERAETDLIARAHELAEAVRGKDLAARQVASLAEVALALTSADTIDDLERIVVERGLPVLGADGGAIVSPAPDGGWRTTSHAVLGERMDRRGGTLPHDSTAPAAWTARTGRRLLLPTRRSGLEFDPGMVEVYRRTGRSGWAFLPLVVQDACLGALAVCWAGEHPLRPDELDLLDGFAAQCAQALQRIRTGAAQRAAARELQQLAEALQQALLTPPPEPEHLQIVVRYRPAAHHAQVGGDWYDAFLQPDGATMLTIGDVVGHDGVAAAKMGQLRGLLRALAYSAADTGQSDAPAAVLTRLESVARGLAVDTLATAVLARIEPVAATATGGARALQWSNAGHLPPVLLHADGTVDFLDAKPDLLLGVDPGAPRRDHRLELPAGSTLLLYTDGLVERRGAALDEGLAGLRDVLTGLTDLTTEQLCDTVLRELAAEAGEDDVALIAVRAAPRPAADVHDTVLDLPHGSDAPAVARRFLAAHPAVPAAALDDAQLLVSELVGNAVRYGRPAIRLRVRPDPAGLAVAVDDGGDALPLLPDGRPDPSAPSGRGLLIVAALAESWGVTPHDRSTGKTVWFTLRA